MRKRIQDLAYARFQYETPIPEFSTERLEMEVLQDQVYGGSFSVRSVNDIPMRGIVYASNPRMVCLTPEFEGTKVNIQFEFHSDGLVEGDVMKGDFYIIYNGGEYNLSFVASVTRFYATTSIGKIKNLFDFANLAQTSYQEAYNIFKAPFFLNIIKETKERLLYRALGGERATLLGMEEFLIATRKKHKIAIEIQDDVRNFTDITEDTKEVIRIRRDQWGYLKLRVTSDSSWLVPVKDTITTEDFVGNFAEAEVIIRPEELHGGNNYGRITFLDLNQTKVCEICIQKKESSQETKKVAGKEKKQLLMQLTRLYLDFRMQRIVTGVWSKESCSCLERLKECDPGNLWFVLYHAQALLVNKQRQEAEWILDAFRRELPEKDTPIYAYYLYLCTLQESDASYIAKVFAQVKEIYHKNQDDIRLFLIMLFLDPELNHSKSRKLQAIEEKIAQGVNSPVLYMEAFYLMKHDVYLLQKADSFERQVLHWAAREKDLTIEVANQVIRLMPQVRKYQPLWFKILEECYRINPQREVLQELCSFGIKWNQFSEKYYKLYQKGIREELRIAGLYEAWLSCAGPEQIEEFPKPVMIYFQYQNNLNYKKQAMLYARIVKNKTNQKSLYNLYQKNIESFAIAQLLEKHIDENLAVLYEEMLNKLAINEEMAEALSKIMYTNRLICKDSDITRVVVVHHELNREQIVPVVNHQAYIQLYSNSYYILAQDAKGERYVPKEDWELQKLLPTGRYVKACIQAKQNEIPFLIHYFEGRRTHHTLLEEDMSHLRYLLEDAEISREYIEEMKPQVIEYYYNSFTGENLDLYLEQVDYVGLERDVRNKLVELMIARGIYHKAYDILTAYGSEQASISKLLIVASQRIVELDYETDTRLQVLCSSIFKRGKYNSYILQYLCSYFTGSLREMEQLWKAAKEFEIDTYELEERFLVQLLYSQGYTEEMEKIFQSYFNSHGQEMVILAYLSFFSYQYFVKRVIMSDSMFLCIQEQLLLENPLNDSCKLAYFRWVVSMRARTGEQDRLMEMLLREYLREHKYFAFYQEIPMALLRKYHLYDRIFVEYRTNPQKHVVLSYDMQGEGNYVEEPMQEMYQGIFVKQFVLFFGEEIPYYVKEVGPEEEHITESGHIQSHDLMAQEDESGYELINGMMISYHLKDGQTLQQLYAHYKNTEAMVEQRFRLL